MIPFLVSGATTVMEVIPVNERRWMGYRELAEYLGKSEASLRQDVCQGRFKDARTGIGRRVYFDRHLIDRALSQGGIE